MAGEKKTWLNRLLTVAAGMMATTAIVLFLHLFGFAAKPEHDSYFISRYLTDSVSVISVVVYFVTSLLLGLLARQPLSLAAGMVLPLPLAALIELLLDSTSHNLIPFEGLLYWLPAFGVAFLGSSLGSRVKQFASRTTNHESQEDSTLAK